MSRIGMVLVALALVTAPVTAEAGRKAEKVERMVRYARYLMLVERDYAQAKSEWKRVLRIDRKNHTALISLAQTQVRLRETGDALKTLARAARLAPRDRATWMQLGRVRAVSGQADKALEAFEKVLELDQHHALAALAAGDLLYARYLKSKDDAVKTRAIDRYRQFLGATAQKRGHQALRIQKLVARITQGAAAAALIEGKELYQRAFTARRGMGGFFEQAYAKLDAVVEAKPKHSEALYYQGLIRMSVKSKKLYSVDLAIEKLAAAGDYAPALAELGRYERKQDDLDAAKTYLDLAVKVDANHQRSWFELGLVHKLTGDREPAVRAFQKAFDLDDGSDVAARAVVDLSHLAPQDRRVMRHFRKNRHQFKGDIFDTEKFKGSIAMLERRLGGIDESCAEQEWLDVMMRRLLEASELKVSTVFTVKVARTPMINAFAVPNGNVYFTRGFLDFAKKSFPDVAMDADNAVIAAVMGHEITHVTKEHVIRSFVFRDAMKLQRFDPQILVHLTRNHEIEADREGMKLMFLAGYDPRWAVKLHAEYAKVLGEVPAGLDHPTFDERIHYLEEFWSNEMAFAYASFNQGTARLHEAAQIEAADLNKAAALYKEAIEDLRRFVQAFARTREALNNMGLAHAKLGLFELARTQPKSPITRWWTEFSVEPELALKFVPLTRRARTRGAAGGSGRAPIPAGLRRARALLGKAVAKDPHYARAHLNLGMVLLATGDYAGAEKELGAVQEQCKKACPVAAAQVANLLGIVHAEQGRIERAVEAFEESLTQQANPGGKAPPRIFNLARALERAEKNDEATEAYQKFLEEHGENDTSSWAVMARTALARLADE